MRLRRVIFPFHDDPPPWCMAQLRSIVGTRPEVSLVRASADLASAIAGIASSHDASLVAVAERKDIAAVVRACPCPLIVLVGADHHPAKACRRIVVPLLRDPEATGTLLPLVGTVALRADATVVLLGVASTGPPGAERSGSEARLEACHAMLKGVPALKRIVSGEAGAAIVGATEGADLLALHRDDPWEAVLGRTRCPVLLGS